jgi:hypothetical protein
MSRVWSSPWSVAVIALLIFFIVLARGGFSTSNGMRAGIAIVGLLLIGFLWPPLGIVIGGVALFYLVFVHGPELFTQLAQPLTNPSGGQ